MGPAIRRAIGEALSRLIQSLDRALDHSLTWRGLGWRLEAARTGRSFAEVVLAHTLVFRVEQVFLIHRRTGLLLLRAQAARGKSSRRVSREVRGKRGSAPVLKRVQASNLGGIRLPRGARASPSCVVTRTPVRARRARRDHSHAHSRGMLGPARRECRLRASSAPRGAERPVVPRSSK